MTDIPKSRALQPPRDWEPVFASTPASSFFGREPSAIARSAFRYLRAFGMEPSTCTALDLGSGEGRDTVYLASEGMRVLSIDIAPSGIEKTRTMLEKAGVPEDRVDLRVADVLQYEYPENAFDLAMAANVFQFLSPGDARDGIRKLRRAVKPGGIAAVGVFSPSMAEWGTDLDSFFTSTPDELMSFFPASDGWLVCDRTEYWTYLVDNDTMGSWTFVVARKP